MLKMPEESQTQDKEEPPSTKISPPEKTAKEHVHALNGNGDKSFLGKIRGIFKGRPDTSLRETLEEYIEEEREGKTAQDSVSAHERELLANILKLKDLKVFDVMIPRADIVAIEADTPQKELLELLAEKQHSRIPVYQETLDNVLGSIHIKDILSTLAKGQKVNIQKLVREVPVVSPTMHVLDLLLHMRESKKHMALVVDEFGGIDGLVTIGDVIETIVGEIDDEYDPDDTQELIENPDGSIIADARYDIDEFERRYGKILTEEEREESETLGGLVFYIAGRVPARGEVLTHDSGTVFEVLDADPRRVNRLRIKNIPAVLD